MILKNLSKSEEFARGVSTGITLPKPSDIPPAPTHTPSTLIALNTKPPAPAPVPSNADDIFGDISDDTRQTMAKVGLGQNKPSTNIPHRNSVFEKPKGLHIGSVVGGGVGHTEENAQTSTKNSLKHKRQEM